MTPGAGSKIAAPATVRNAFRHSSFNPWICSPMFPLPPGMDLNLEGENKTRGIRVMCVVEGATCCQNNVEILQLIALWKNLFQIIPDPAIRLVRVSYTTYIDLQVSSSHTRSVPNQIPMPVLLDELHFLKPTSESDPALLPMKIPTQKPWGPVHVKVPLLARAGL